MKRLHLIEWEDQHWFPKSWRDYGTDYLRFIASKFDIYKVIHPILKKGLDASGDHQWIDCASGGGGGLTNLVRTLRSDYPDLKVTLTDYYPNVQAFEQTKESAPDVFDIDLQSVNAKALPPKYSGKFRTMFASFHHFQPEDASQILQNAVDTKSPIAIFEPVGKNPASLISMLFVIVNVWLFTPFIRPVRWAVIPFIYLIPIVPLYIMWDGIVSVLRTYSEAELNKMISRLRNTDSFTWEVGSIKNGPMPTYYLLGIPKKSE